MSPLCLSHALGDAGSLSLLSCLFSADGFLPSFAAASVAMTATLL